MHGGHYRMSLYCFLYLARIFSFIIIIIVIVIIIIIIIIQKIYQ